VFDVSDLNQPIIVAEFDHGNGTIDHNKVSTRGRYAFAANFRSGLRILDICDSAVPTSAGHFEILLSADAARLDDAWSDYLYFRSAMAVVSGIEQGPFVLRPMFADWPPPPSLVPEPEQLQFGDLAGQAAEQPDRSWLATTTVSLRDADENALEGVTVGGSWSTGASRRCTTDSVGQYSISTNLPSAASSVTLRVESLSRDSDTYVSVEDRGSEGATMRAPAAPPLPEIYWFANHETGEYSTSGWEGPWDSGDATITFATGRVHSGKYALRLTIDTTNGTAAVRLPVQRVTVDGQLVVLPDAAYYSAWYYIPAGIRPNSWWNVMDFKSAYRRISDGVGWSDPVYRFGLWPSADGANYTLALYDHVGSDGRYVPGGQKDPGIGTVARSAVEFPADTWVHFETFYKWSIKTDGRITSWIDGKMAWDVQNIITEYDQSLEIDHEPVALPRQWKVNHYSSGLKPSPATIWVDDAAIAAARVYGSVP
jgi:hypothetical protein